MQEEHAALSLTVAVITKNEEQHLAACLESVKPLNCRILIIDSGSSDNTLHIAQQYGAECHVFDDWQGFGVQRNRAHEFIRTDWVLWLDADERLDAQTRQDLLFRLPETVPDGATVFAINRLPIVYGRAIRHCGWYPDVVVRVYPPQHCRYSMDLVHESVQTLPQTQIQLLQGEVLHETYADLRQHLTKMLHYTDAWAKQNRHRRSHPVVAMLKAFFSFLKIYFVKKGFADGMHGFIIAVMGAIYTFVKYTQLWLLHHNAKEKQ